MKDIHVCYCHLVRKPGLLVCGPRVAWFEGAWFKEHVRTDHWLFISCNILVQITWSILCSLMMRVKKDHIVRLFLYCIYIYISLHWTKKNGCIFQIHQPGARWRICIGNTVTLPTSLRRGYDSHFNEGRGEPSGSWEVPGQRSSIVDGEFLHPFWRSHQMGVILVADFIHIYIYTL